MQIFLDVAIRFQAPMGAYSVRVISVPVGLIPDTTVIEKSNGSFQKQKA